MKNSFIQPTTDNMPIIRIAPVCNGKIYVTPHPFENGEGSYMDLPMVENVEHVSVKSDKAARKVKEKYHLHIQTDASPRFCVQHKSAATGDAIVYLYILPLRQEDEIRFHNGRFVDAEHIQAHPEEYDQTLLEESELLGMAAELWADYYSGSVSQEQ